MSFLKVASAWCAFFGVMLVGVAAPAAPTHVMTLVTAPNHKQIDSAWEEMRPWVTWISTDAEGAVRAHALGIHTIRYANPNLICSLDSGCLGDPGSSYITDESAFEHCNGGTDKAHRATLSYDGKTVQWIGNVRSPALLTALRRYISAMSKNAEGVAHPFDAILLDDTILPSDRWNAKTWQYAGFSAAGGGIACRRFPWDGYPGDKAQLAAWRAFNRAAPLPVIVEGLGAMGKGPYVSSPSHAFSLLENGSIPGNTLGALFEGAWGGMNEHRPKEREPFWQKASNDQIAVVGFRKNFLAYSYPGARDTDVRGYMYASFLLTYDPRFSLYSTYDPDDFPSHVSIGQETTLVPLDPLQTAAHNVEELRVSGDAYRREFLHCFIAGRAVGRCAVVVNPDPSRSVPFPRLSTAYLHSLAISGRGLLRRHGDDGTLRSDGPPPPAQLGPSGWAIVFAPENVRLLK